MRTEARETWQQLEEGERERDLEDCKIEIHSSQNGRNMDTWEINRQSRHAEWNLDKTSCNNKIEGQKDKDID